MKKILIIGGMGPQASLLLHKRIIDRAAQTGARNGVDFPEITHLSLAIDDFIADPSTMEQAVSTIRQRLGYLWRGKLYTYRHSLQHRSFTAAKLARTA